MANDIWWQMCRQLKPPTVRRAHPFAAQESMEQFCIVCKKISSQEKQEWSFGLLAKFFRMFFFDKFFALFVLLSTHFVKTVCTNDEKWNRASQKRNSRRHCDCTRMDGKRDTLHKLFFLIKNSTNTGSNGAGDRAPQGHPSHSRTSYIKIFVRSWRFGWLVSGQDWHWSTSKTKSREATFSGSFLWFVFQWTRETRNGFEIKVLGTTGEGECEGHPPTSKVKSNSSFCFNSVVVLSQPRGRRLRLFSYTPPQSASSMLTGANSGLGKEVAQYLASKNASVYLVCRNAERGKKAVQVCLLLPFSTCITFSRSEVDFQPHHSFWANLMWPWPVEWTKMKSLNLPMRMEFHRRNTQKKREWKQISQQKPKQQDTNYGQVWWTFRIWLQMSTKNMKRKVGCSKAIFSEVWGRQF